MTDNRIDAIRARVVSLSWPDAKSVNDVLWLLAEVGRLEALNEKLSVKLQEYIEKVDHWVDLHSEEETKNRTLTAERDHWAKAARYAGICMTCQGPNGAPEPYGCTDCLNTGWSSEYHNEVASLTAERDALKDCEEIAYQRGVSNERKRAEKAEIAARQAIGDSHE